MPLLPARPVRYLISISFVKSDWKLRQKTGPSVILSQSVPAHLAPSSMALIKIDFHES